ncbi:MAG: sterol desaturase [Bacteroidetes bacterium 24-39-8]|nr:MAG: sterol desaturase [Bacteroidetes bacterium 24-39-8]OZA63423.1 MAG: sterol desaturase [Sphingobacteriia bacterium 39-39-8]HQR93672.1 sterol desaturase family protein [Sediminibacterium sp.]HQS55320.1 sterol desaturase family protein [Sediminibacterium sp.]
MEQYGKILLIAMPVFLLLVLFEKWWGWSKGQDTVRNMDMISSLSSGVTNVTKDVLGLSITIISYGWMVDHLAIVQVSSRFWCYVIAFMALDLTGYLVHRIDHEYNFFWNAHIIHHSSEEYNLACALRQSISSFFRVFTIFLLPAALLGVPATVIGVVAPLHLFAQFWYHTRHIGKMGILEKIIVTPSHHRVHHAINPEYLDKNYGQIFIFWDKWFGTFQEELPHVPAVYGITRPAKTWNPIKINFMHMALLVKDAWRTQNWKDKFRIWIMPTGWRPSDVAEKYPVFKIEDPYHFEKYDTKNSTAFSVWIWFQLFMLLGLVSYLFGNIASIGSPGIFIYGAFIYLFVYSYTEQMDQSKQAWIWDLLKTIIGFTILFQTGDWFGAKSILPQIPYIIGIYLICSSIACWYFSITEGKQLVSKVSV